MIAIRKPGKPLDDPSSYQTISLLWCCYTLLERLLLTILALIFESVIPPEHAGFRKKRNTCDQVLALTSYIESGFQKKLKTGAALIDMSAAYDIVLAHEEVIECHQVPNNNQTNRQPYFLAKLSGIPRQPSQPKAYHEERASPRIRTCAVGLQRIHQ